MPAVTQPGLGQVTLGKGQKCEGGGMIAMGGTQSVISVSLVSSPPPSSLDSLIWITVRRAVVT